MVPWSKWDDVPDALQAAIDWAWRNAGPETPQDRARMKAMDGLTTLETLLDHELILWTFRLTRRALPWVASAKTWEALAPFFGRSASTLKKYQEATGVWKAAKLAAHQIHHPKHKTVAALNECSECLCVDSLGYGGEGFCIIEIPRLGGGSALIERKPAWLHGNRGTSLFGSGWAHAPGMVWVFEQHEKVAEGTADGLGLRTWRAPATPAPINPKKGWLELFRWANPELTRLYSVSRSPEPSGEVIVRIFPEPSDEATKDWITRSLLDRG